MVPLVPEMKGDVMVSVPIVINAIFNTPKPRSKRSWNATFPHLDFVPTIFTWTSHVAKGLGTYKTWAPPWAAASMALICVIIVFKQGDVKCVHSYQNLSCLQALVTSVKSPTSGVCMRTCTAQWVYEWQWQWSAICAALWVSCLSSLQDDASPYVIFGFHSHTKRMHLVLCQAAGALWLHSLKEEDAAL